MPDIDQRALDSLSVAPDEDTGRDPRQDAGQDKSIAKRLQKNPDSADARLDNALDESMDGSDPPAQTQPGASTDAPDSSGYDPEAEKGLTHKRA
ncbi:hypothetical protein [Sphingomonas sp. R86521]|uniref:hypothetical protein n=1 Tax=Sphingomonas sp. R86521 TaxID=3093860 RepID=UPI0036D2708C